MLSVRQTRDDFYTAAKPQPRFLSTIVAAVLCLLWRHLKADVTGDWRGKGTKQHWSMQYFCATEKNHGSCTLKPLRLLFLSLVRWHWISAPVAVRNKEEGAERWTLLDLGKCLFHERMRIACWCWQPVYRDKKAKQEEAPRCSLQIGHRNGCEKNRDPWWLFLMQSPSSTKEVKGTTFTICFPKILHLWTPDANDLFLIAMHA